MTWIGREVESIVPGLFVGTAAGAIIGYFVAGSGSPSGSTGGDGRGGNGPVAGALLGGAGGGLAGALVSEMATEHHDMRGLSESDRITLLESILEHDTNSSLHEQHGFSGAYSPAEQGKAEYTLYLKDGHALRCTRFEMISDSVFSVRLTDGREQTIAAADFAQFVSDEQPNTAGGGSATTTWGMGSGRPFFLSIVPFASLCIPVGEFARTDNQSGGAAKTGYGFGLEADCAVNSHLSWIVSFAIQFYGFDASPVPFASVQATSWRLFLPMTGIRISTPLLDGLTIFGEGIIGWDAQSSPEMTVWWGSTLGKLESGSGGAVAYSLAGGILISGRLQLRARYIDGGSPTYSITQTLDTQTLPRTIKQPSAAIEISLGVVL
ncbi:MAG TPA: hypothetical protein VL126_04845 [Bacteroidota bacterium]|nr:hypothetical protein [Bacteroidota bacterium]